MAIRRARIKPVISLPPRRKHYDAGNNTKTTKTLKTKYPQTSVDTNKNQDDLDRRTPGPDSPLKSPLTDAYEYQDEEVPSPLTQEVTVTPKKSETVWFSSDHNEFVALRKAGSQNRIHVVSHLVQNSEAEMKVQSLPSVTLNENPEIPKEKSAVKRPEEADVTVGKSKKAKKDVSCTIVSSDVSDDCMAPRNTESGSEDNIMDGIVPLQPSSALKPLAKLKKAIISENAEVLFDPIVSLPSQCNVWAKLRPIPRLSSLRRNSMQGSTSESEDETRRALLRGRGASTSGARQRRDSHSSLTQALPIRGAHRVRSDSVTSSVSQTPTISAVPSSPVKDKHVSKSQREAISRRAAALRRNTEPGPKETLTIYDLIFYNPATDPIVPDKDEVKAKEANAEEARKAAEEINDKSEDEKAEPAPVPQVKLGPNGEIMLDEKSLVIKQSVKRTLSRVVVQEGAWTGAAGRYRRTPRTKCWSDADTVRFYRALAALGTDFLLMGQLFPGRTRRDLKLKFKREERFNLAQIDKALRTTCEWDAKRLMEEFAAERAREEEAARAQAAEYDALVRETQHDKLKRKRARASRGSKALGTSVLPSKHNDFTADDVIEHYQLSKASKKKGPQTPRKRGRPRSEPSPPTATATQDTSSTQPTADVAPARNIESPEPQDIPDETPNKPGLPSNVKDGSLVVLTVDDPNSPTKKMLQTYVASGGGKLTPVVLAPAVLNSVITYMTNTKSNRRSSPHLTSSSCEHEASQDGPPSTTLPSTYTITEL